MAPTWLQQLLDRESTDKYYITYKGYRANHLSHGIVALQRLGATDKEIEPFVEKYKKRLVPKEKLEHHDTVKSNVTEDYLGKGTGFYMLRKMYEDKLDSQYPDVESLIKHELPKVADGMLGNAYHGIIQIGYGFIAGSNKIVCEGLAYSFHSFRAPFTEEINHPRIADISNFGKGKRNIVDIISDVKRDKGILEMMLRKSEEEQRVKAISSVFIRREKVLFEECPAKLFDFADQTQLPEWFDCTKTDIDQAVKLGRWIVQQAVKVYVMSDSVNDFFLLHGVTGAWTMYKLLPLLDCNDAIRMCRVFMATYFATYVIQECPALNKKPEEFYNGPVNQETWDAVVMDAKTKSWEVHVLKLVQCCYEMYREDESDPESLFYLAACYSAMKNDFARIWGMKIQIKNNGDVSDDDEEETLGTKDTKY